MQLSIEEDNCSWSLGEKALWLFHVSLLLPLLFLVSQSSKIIVLDKGVTTHKTGLPACCLMHPVLTNASVVLASLYDYFRSAYSYYFHCPLHVSVKQNHHSVLTNASVVLTSVNDLSDSCQPSLSTALSLPLSSKIIVLYWQMPLVLTSVNDFSDSSQCSPSTGLSPDLSQAKSSFWI